ncbi:MAG TPA: Rpn family recombination-promoting nuclease/putative transposase [Thermoanaerobaculia bacterium]|nr:Rpn family recombination-promoting nuclease/putative transposase [Thermoanaerobaculia bacterium]
MGPTDGRFKLFFSYRRMMKDLVLGFLREGWLHGLDLATLEMVPSTFITRRFRQRHGDCLWRARFDGPDGTSTDFYLLVEFQSKPDRYMPLRLLGYEALLLERLVRRQELAAGGDLPPVVALVVPSGKRHWNVPRELRTQFAPVPEEAARLLPSLSYLLIDRTLLETGALDPQDNLAAVFFRIEEARSPEDLLSLARPLHRMLPAKSEPELRRAFTDLLVDTFQTAFPGVTIPPIEDLEDMSMLEENMIRWRNKVIREARKEGLKEGRQEGIKEGRQEGKVDGMRSFVLGLMEQRFGPLSPTVRRKVDKISSAEQLQDLGNRLLTAGSLSDLGLGG